MKFSKFGQAENSIAALPRKYQSALDRDLAFEKTPKTFPTQIFKGSVSLTQGGGLSVDYESGGTLVSVDPYTGQVVVYGTLLANGGINTGTLVATEIIGGTLNNAVLGSPTIIGGTASNLVINNGTLGTPVINGGTVTGAVLSGGTLSGVGGAGGGLGLYVGAAASGFDPSSTYYLGATQGLEAQSVADLTRVYIPKNGTITACTIFFAMTAGTSTSETGTIAIRLNDTTDTNVTTGFVLNATRKVFTNTALSIAVSSGDYFVMKLMTPAWSAPVSGVYPSGIVSIP